jgi:hypothetical protein
MVVFHSCGKLTEGNPKNLFDSTKIRFGKGKMKGIQMSSTDSTLELFLVQAIFLDQLLHSSSELIVNGHQFDPSTSTN